MVILSTSETLKVKTMKTKRSVFILVVAIASIITTAHRTHESAEAGNVRVPPGSGMADIFAADTTETYALVKVESAVEGREISFKGRIVDPDGDFWISLEDGTTPYEERFVADDLVGLFRNLDPDVGMVVSLDLVEDGSWKSGLTADWDFAMIMKRGDEIMTAGL